jgi:hypothetical protein
MSQQRAVESDRMAGPAEFGTQYRLLNVAVA